MTDPTATTKQPNVIKRLWKKTGLTPFFIVLACKGALPSTIALAAYEATGWADTYTTLGYLVAIISHLSLAIQPRAKFLQSLFTSLIFTCTGAALALLEIQCVVAARRRPHAPPSTGGSGSPETPTYNAAACAVAGTWLFVWVFIANSVKAARPQLMLPVIQSVIFVVVASVYAPSFPSMEAGESFVRRLLITFLTGYAVATGVSLFVLPITSRASVTKQLGGFTGLLKACIAAHGNYMKAIHNSTGSKGEASAEETNAAEALKATIMKSNELLGKIKLEIGFARKELAYGKLSPHHFSEIYSLIRKVYLPVIGMTTFLEIVTALREHRATISDVPDVKEAMEAARKLESEEWEEVVTISQEAYAGYQTALFSGLQHVAYQLELEKRPKTVADVEKAAESSVRPGDRGFTMHLETELLKYEDLRIGIIQEWATGKGLALPKHFWRNVTDQPQLHRQTTAIVRERLNQHQLYMILYMNFLNFSVGKALLELAKYADGLVEDGTMARRRIINPGFRRIHKLFMDALTQSSIDETLSAGVNGGSNIYMGDALNKKKDPEHLPPTNAYEKATDFLRRVPAFFQSRCAAFGFRAALATMSIAIIAYLRRTHPFFLEQRGMWALIMVAISMDPFAGQGLFGFAGRVAGTTFAMVASIVIWYMCDHKHAAIIPIFWLYMSGWMLFIIKLPQFAVIGMISSVTVVLIIGYELQVDVIGRRLATSNGQAYYPVELLAVYRLATVGAGLFVAWIWTYFPFPITTHGALRRNVGDTLYILANFYSCVHSTLDVRLHLGHGIHDLPKGHPVYELDSARNKVFGKVLLMLNQLRVHLKFSKIEPTFGGKFPRDKYAELVDSLQNVFSYFALLVYSSNAFIDSGGDRDALRDATMGTSQWNGNALSATANEDANDIDEKKDNINYPRQRLTKEEEERWLVNFRAFVADAHQRVTSHEITKTLCLLSSAIRSSQPLPPYLLPPRPVAQSMKEYEEPNTDAAAAEKRKQRREAQEQDLLGIEHFAHPAYAAFAVGEVASAFVTAELGKIVRIIRELVGEVDFSFHVHSTEGPTGLKRGTTGDEKWWEVLVEELQGTNGKTKTKGE